MCCIFSHLVCRGWFCLDLSQFTCRRYRDAGTDFLPVNGFDLLCRYSHWVTGFLICCSSHMLQAPRWLDCLFVVHWPFSFETAHAFASTEALAETAFFSVIGFSIHLSQLTHFVSWEELWLPSCQWLASLSELTYSRCKLHRDSCTAFLSVTGYLLMIGLAVACL